MSVCLATPSFRILVRQNSRIPEFFSVSRSACSSEMSVWFSFYRAHHSRDTKDLP